MPDHVNRPVLTGIYLQVVTLAGVDASSSAPYIQVQLGQLKPVPIAIDRQGRGISSRPCRASDAAGPQHRVRPGCHARVAEDADRSQRLDPAVLQNLVLILFYEGEIRWS